VYESGYPISEKEFSLLLGKAFLLPVRLPGLLYIGCDDTDIGQITNRLKKEGFIVLNHQKRSSHKREPKFRVVKSQAKLNQRDLRYFDPMARVARYVRSVRLEPALLVETEPRCMDSMMLRSQSSV